jgi:hypothetical protein
MFLKRILIVYSIVISVILFFTNSILAQIKPIYRFKAINIPVSLKIEHSILEKGAYDLEFLRNSSPVLYFLRIMKKGKILYLLQGEELSYGIISALTARDPNIPDKPTLKMTLNKSEKFMTILFESGRNTSIFPFIKARFKIQYEESEDKF